MIAPASASPHVAPDSGAADRRADSRQQDVASPGGERLGETPAPGLWVALLPVLDPTVMGSKERSFYLGPHRERLFDRAGNAGTTAWVDGRIVGCWVQDDDGVVAVRLLEQVPPGAREALDDQAQQLTTWLDGERVSSLIRPPAMQAACTR